MQVPHTVQQTSGMDLPINSLPDANAARTLLFICRPWTISTAMMAAIESEFPWLSVKTASDLQSAAAAFDGSVQLVLADIAFAPALHRHWAALTRFHRNVGLAFMGSDDEIALGDLEARDSEIIHGIVPFNVNLDVFLSALRIILRGGRYFPPTSRLRKRVPLDKAKDLSETEVGAQNAGNSPTRMIDRLTKREKEILARIAMGNQNKIIAAALGLSEHTVKIHIHNIITKLGVHNRTEVVALYFEHGRKETAGNAQHDTVHS